MPESGHGAVFLDRDGTIITDPGYLHRPEAVHLLPGAAQAIQRLNRARWPVVTVTNQSGIARGLYAESDYRLVERRLAELLAAEGARIDAAFFCPHHPQVTAPPPCECRKPGTKLFREAAAQLGLDLTRSWFVGDRPGDVAPAHALGGRGLLVLTGAGATHQAQAAALGVSLVTDLAAAVATILGPVA
jgi:D-glycero-D-manno-heptose 1,7-bisphosphate phosphatase